MSAVHTFIKLNVTPENIQIFFLQIQQTIEDVGIKSDLLLNTYIYNQYRYIRQQISLYRHKALQTISLF